MDTIIYGMPQTPPAITCLMALKMMAKDAHLDADEARLLLALKVTHTPPYSDAELWHTGIERAMTLLT
jgi:hypothetical protein